MYALTFAVAVTYAVVAVSLWHMDAMSLVLGVWIAVPIATVVTWAIARSLST